MEPARRPSMRIAIDRESPIVGDERFSSPGVPPKHAVSPEGTTYPPVPTRLYPVLLEGEGATLRIGSVGEYRAKGGNRWAWYCLVRDERNFMRKEPTAGSAAKRILQQLIEKLGDEEISGYLYTRRSA
jgi:hypothetical protein